MSRSKLVHRCGVRCATEARLDFGVQPELVVDVTEGKVPLWARGTTLAWRFDEESFERYGDAVAMKRKVERLMNDAIAAWGSSSPVTFRRDDDSWDFDIYLRVRRDCDEGGCVLASAFFPSSQRERLVLYPSMFENGIDRDEQLATMVHELGHIFGLRHYFAQRDKYEKKFPSLVFGEHLPYTIMNYGSESVLTDTDKADLARLYEAAWSTLPADGIGKEVHLVQAWHMRERIIGS